VAEWLDCFASAFARFSFGGQVARNDGVNHEG